MSRRLDIRLRPGPPRPQCVSPWVLYHPLTDTLARHTLSSLSPGPGSSHLAVSRITGHGHCPLVCPGPAWPAAAARMFMFRLVILSEGWYGGVLDGEVLLVLGGVGGIQLMYTLLD